MVENLKEDARSIECFSSVSAKIKDVCISKTKKIDNEE
jgi:hypothetical protein